MPFIVVLLLADSNASSQYQMVKYYCSSQDKWAYNTMHVTIESSHIVPEKRLYKMNTHIEHPISFSEHTEQRG